MNTRLPYEKQDLALLRVPGYVFLASLSIASVLYFASGILNRNADFELLQANARYENVVVSVREIAAEEATIIRYIDRYKQIAEEGTFDEEDRLALIEKIGALRAQYSLYPIAMDIGPQGTLALQYDPMDSNPGEPVNIRFSEVSLSYPLLHEEDLSRLLNAVIAEPGLMLPTSCSIQTANLRSEDFSQLGSNLEAQCKLIWFTFDLNPAEAVYEY